MASRQYLWQLRHPEKKAAHEALHRALKSGIIQKPEVCMGCGGPDPEGHHPDYSKPLEVEWLCNACHHKRHQKSISSPYIRVAYHGRFEAMDRNELSASEIQMASMAREGLTNPQIASSLGVSVQTVKHTLYVACFKLRAMAA
jgi:Bacterial regulatory proteins, luxR family